MKKILVIRFSSIGDIVLTTPVVRCLKNQLEDIELHVLTKKKFSNLYHKNIYIDKVFEFDNSLKDNIADLRKENYDYVVDLQKNKRSKKIVLALKINHSSFPKLNVKKFLLTTFKINILPDVHIVDRYFKAVETLGVKNDFQGLDFFISPNNEYDISSLPSEFQKGYYAFVIGGTYKTKILPAVKIIEVIKKLDKPVILLGGPDDVERAEEILSAVESPRPQSSSSVLSLVGKINLEQSASVVKQSMKVLTNDTGLMHVAAAFHKPIVSVWGNTVPEFGMCPYLPKEPEKCHIVECKDVRCRPCSKLGFKECPQKHFKCMMKIDADEIAEKLKS
ncbi:MAG: glycosyltransferase family 9 protein [Bacteroidales bacterium]|nr:glycosyltransferase family 9 protein [Bacteroidales bacterium]